MLTFEGTIRSMDTDLSEKYLITACSDSAIRLYSIVNKEMSLISELMGHSGPVSKAIFINQGEIIASSDFTGKLIIWKLEDSHFKKKVEKQVCVGPLYDITARYLESALSIFCACDKGILYTCTFDAQFNCTENSEEVHRYGISCISANADHVVTGGLDFSISLRSAEGSEYFNHHSSAITDVAIAPSNNFGKTVFASCAEDKKIVIIEKIDGQANKQVIELDEPCYNIEWSKSGLSFTVGYGSNKFKTFILGETGKYEEIEMQKLDQ
jgi:protein transport protein SEC13